MLRLRTYRPGERPPQLIGISATSPVVAVTRRLSLTFSMRRVFPGPIEVRSVRSFFVKKLLILHSKPGPGLKRDEAGGGRFLPWQFHEYGHHCLGRNRKVPSSLEHIARLRFQPDRYFVL